MAAKKKPGTKKAPAGKHWVKGHYAKKPKKKR
jgi:hypothetical protein